MSSTRKPLRLLPDRTYIHVTASNPPTSETQLPTPSTGGESVTIKYLGPVGELQGEHVYEVQHATSGQPLSRDDAQAVQAVTQAVKALDGVKGCKVLETQQRAKR